MISLVRALQVHLYPRGQEHGGRDQRGADCRDVQQPGPDQEQ